jgi:hypothetical protein
MDAKERLMKHLALILTLALGLSACATIGRAHAANMTLSVLEHITLRGCYRRHVVGAFVAKILHLPLEPRVTYDVGEAARELASAAFGAAFGLLVKVDASDEDVWNALAYMKADPGIAAPIARGVRSVRGFFPKATNVTAMGAKMLSRAALLSPPARRRGRCAVCCKSAPLCSCS